MYDLVGFHDFVSGIIFATLIIATIKSVMADRKQFFLYLATLLYLVSILPTPLHGTHVLPIIVVVLLYLNAHRLLDKEIDVWREELFYSVIALLLVVLNSIVGLIIKGII